MKLLDDIYPDQLNAHSNRFVVEVEDLNKTIYVCDVAVMVNHYTIAGDYDTPTYYGGEIESIECKIAHTYIDEEEVSAPTNKCEIEAEIAYIVENKLN